MCSVRPCYNMDREHRSSRKRKILREKIACSNQRSVFPNEIFLYTCCTRIIVRASLIFPVSREHVALKKILVIRKHNHLGDMLCSLPLYAAVKQRWPDCSITLLAAPTSYPVPLREINSYLDEVVWYSKGSVLDVLRMQLRLRRARFDMVIVPSTIRLSRTSHITARLTGAALRVGVRSIDGAVNDGAKWLSTAVDVAWETDRVHQVHRNLDIAAAAGCPDAADPLPLLRINPSPDALAAARSLFAEIPENLRLVGVHPGAGKLANIWPVERFASVLSTLNSEAPISLLITAGTPDAAVSSKLAALLDGLGIPHRLLMDAPIDQLAAAVGQTALFLTNDTGTMHVAAFAGARVVSLFGPTPAWEWAPMQSGCTAIQSKDGNILSIGTDEVLGACRDALEAGDGGF